MTKTLDVRNPRTGLFDDVIMAACAADIEKQAVKLRAAQRRWREQGVEERVRVLRGFADALEERRTDIVSALSCDTGRRRLSQMEFDGVIASIARWTKEAPALVPEAWVQGQSNPSIRHAPQFVPYQLAGVISPWNFPLTLSLIDAIPALLAGCAVMVKPSEITPRFARPLEQAICAAGLSDVFAIIYGDGASGAALVDAVDVVCFTGSVETGRKVAVAAAANLIPAFLELGGKDPLIVLESADVEKASDAALRGSILATGQACQSVERIYVQRPIYDAFVARLTEKAEAVRLNWPDPDQGDIGPIIFCKQADKLKAQINDAIAKGAEIKTGGVIEDHGGGLWLRPTVITNVNHDMAIMREETFGPVMPVMAFDSAPEAVALANDTVFGLSAAVIAGARDEAEAVAREIDAGAVSLNDTSLTGVFFEAEKHSFKCSGLGGSRMGAAGFQRFFRRKALIEQTGAPAPIAAFSEKAETN